MRAACETDLVRSGYQLKDVTEWMGHSYKVAENHYLRAREEEFDRAVKNGAVKSGDNEPKIKEVTQNPDGNEFSPPKNSVRKAVLQASAQDCLKEQGKSKSPCFTGLSSSVQQGATGLIAKAGLR